ncbi:L-2-amino-thiazoline-4-carboxylic acid hydrolase [Bacteroidota bacterium]
MKKTTIIQTSRRQFLTKTIPVCALSCLGASKIFASTSTSEKTMIPQDKHKFDKSMEFSVRRFWEIKAFDALRIIKPIVDEMGEEKAVQFLKNTASIRAIANGARFKERKQTDDFETFKTRFIGPNSYSETLIEAQVVENTPKAFEIKVTECIVAAPYLSLNAGVIGHAYQCWGDHCWQDGYNKKIKLIRDKTLMQGQDFCNHRYVYEG